MRAKWVGFEIPDEFVVGYGIDYAQRNRNLPHIGAVRFISEVKPDLRCTHHGNHVEGICKVMRLGWKR